ncbi:hypothetical protein [Yoonia algicola]|uniref:Uncharacterized protein n=1 Tax=Yoonia algicola TaxID=3137368 RepID=A0AAN0NI33_9RHOB
MTNTTPPITITLNNGAHANGLSSTSKAGSICDLARQLINAGHDPEALAMIYRDGTLCFKPSKLKNWAKLAVSEETQRSVAFIKWKPFPEALAA